MRITSGFLKNQTLKVPKTIRPTSEKLRQVVFNICQNQIEGMHFLDIFAGSGAMGIEALSRGAAKATFIEKSRASLRAIQENIKRFNLEDQATVLPGDALTVLKHLSKSSEQFDCIFIDPPYGLKVRDGQETYGEATLALIDASELLSQNGIVFFEEASKPSTILTQLKIEKERQMGDTILIQYTN